MEAAQAAEAAEAEAEAAQAAKAAEAALDWARHAGHAQTPKAKKAAGPSASLWARARAAVSANAKEAVPVGEGTPSWKVAGREGRSGRG